MENIARIAEKSIETAERWMRESVRFRGKSEEKFGRQIQSMLSNKKDKLLLIELLDQSFRAKSPARSMNQIKYLFNKYGMAEFFSPKERFLLRLFLKFGGILPGLSMGIFENMLRDEVSGVVLKGEIKYLVPHIRTREKEGVRLNLNFIGEAVLGEKEAAKRRRQYVDALKNPGLKYISIKASTTYSQISSLGYEKTLKILEGHLTEIYRAARDNKYIDSDGALKCKFINLDMEEYRDMEIVYELFMRILDLQEFKDFSAGIVVQAYIPDSFKWLVKLTEWAKNRVAAGGAPVIVRLVKGANMEMEHIESDSKHWPMVTYEDKLDSDANFKKNIMYMLSRDNAPSVHVGVASHNIFDLAFAYETAKAYGTSEYLQFESLEGMVESIRQAIGKDGQKMVVYCPTAKKENFTNAIAYLVRRLDENTGEQNFLRHSFNLAVGSAEWNKLKNIFSESVKRIDTVKNDPKRTQDRNVAPECERIDFSKYAGEIDTDFVLTQNRKWAENIVEKWKNIASENIDYGSVIGGKEFKNGETVVIYDKSQYPEKRPVGQYHLADEALLKEAVNSAEKGFHEWNTVSFDEKLKIFEKAVWLFRRNRGDLIGISAAEVGKVFTETDIEVSEAVDFIYFYCHAMKTFHDNYPHLTFEGKGIGVVISPWNFPVAIPVGGIMTSLISGNSTIFKPASLSTLTGRMLCELFWEAGVPKNVLQFVAAKGSMVEKAIIKDARVKFSVFTGSESTAYNILTARPDLIISAETGGKDGTILTALSDRDQSVKNVIHSAFSNSGQKCSATSLLALEDEVFNDKLFKETLKDAAESVKVGSVWDLGNRIGALSDLPSGDLKTAIEDKGEWLVPPKFENGNPYMMRPAIKWGVHRGTLFHMRELFGPVLTVMNAKDFNEAIDIVNEPGYGLTAGLETLDDREWALWSKMLHAGNLYINRSTTGAIVLRQPFGGMRKSSVGLGRKAGTYNYVVQFTEIKEKSVEGKDVHAHPLAEKLAGIAGEDAQLFVKVSSNYNYNAKEVFEKVTDPMNVRGEDNQYRYLKVPEVVVRYCKGDPVKDLGLIILAVSALEIPFTLSFDTACDTEFIGSFAVLGLKAVQETEREFCRRFIPGVRVRYVSAQHITPEAYDKMYKNYGFFASYPVLCEGRIELLNYLMEQCVSTSYHRYGNLGARK
ncbi:MAG: bifunctional proline dehydrogenase/L-glutamate gamma-semialdehyde dehydrogenase [Deferribacteraceae bacterium]|jgi:RHH-type proline utilization regulon transcriptional repressor/proline dehydrogenase/delta 1-pyrroline-5-carboxylate dehydrogenase|nr:bifunctional proline dehydrogenase/L-glutamate gamma-semialdehyde dehydrogenase [Deferribacteraceae bacterium]